MEGICTKILSSRMKHIQPLSPSGNYINRLSKENWDLRNANNVGRKYVEHGVYRTLPIVVVRIHRHSQQTITNQRNEKTEIKTMKYQEKPRKGKTKKN